MISVEGEVREPQVVQRAIVDIGTSVPVAPLV
jgi:hypothetical protein